MATATCSKVQYCLVPLATAKKFHFGCQGGALALLASKDGTNWNSWQAAMLMLVQSHRLIDSLDAFPMPGWLLFYFLFRSNAYNQNLLLNLLLHPIQHHAAVNNLHQWIGSEKWSVSYASTLCAREWQVANMLLHGAHDLGSLACLPYNFLEDGQNLAWELQLLSGEVT